MVQDSHSVAGTPSASLQVTLAGLGDVLLTVNHCGRVDDSIARLWESLQQMLPRLLQSSVWCACNSACVHCPALYQILLECLCWFLLPAAASWRLAEPCWLKKYH